WLSPARHRYDVGVPDRDHDLEGGLDHVERQSGVELTEQRLAEVQDRLGDLAHGWGGHAIRIANLGTVVAPRSAPTIAACARARHALHRPSRTSPHAFRNDRLHIRITPHEPHALRPHMVGRAMAAGTDAD